MPGGDDTSLYFLENSVVRKRFPDPRIHFALNCASISCPRLSRHVFLGNRLNAQLDAETRRFVGEARNVTIDPESGTVQLSSIFDWYEGDFVNWDRSAFDGKKPSLRAYVAHYLPSEQAQPFLQPASYEIRFRPYDWGLNDQIAEAN